MKKTIFISMMLLLCIHHTWCQTSDTVSLKEMDIPNSPAFILLDQAPSTIERPNSTKAFALSIINAIQDNNGIPMNYAIDLTPFWFFKHQNMTSLKYAGYNPESKKQRIFGNIERASISFAFANTMDTATQTPVNNISIGARLNLLSIKSQQDLNDLVEANSSLIKLMKERDERLQHFIGDPTLSVTNPALYHIKVQEFFREDEEKQQSEENVLSEILARKPLLAIDGAIGYSTFFQDNTFADGHFGRFGAWLTLNYSQHLTRERNGKNYLSLYVIGRYLSDGSAYLNGKYNKVDNFDIGGKIEFEFRKIAIAYEYVYRKNNISNSFRSNGMLKYKVSDKIFLTGAFGKNFGDANNIISLLGLNWGFMTGNEKSIVKE